MKTKSVPDSLAEGFEPSPLPPVGPDGSLMIPTPLARAPVAPRLCELGPCRNYHRLESQAQGHSFADGTEGLHVQVSHSCYPSVGIEVELGDIPVLRCNRWAPADLRDPAFTNVARIRQTALASPAGGRFTHDLRRWEDARAEQNRAFDAIDASSPVEIVPYDATLPDPSDLPEGDE